MGYWFYKNGLLRAHKAKIHIAKCCYCQNGGVARGSQGNENGRWVGPFHSLKAAESAAQEWKIITSRCKRCLSGMHHDGDMPQQRFLILHHVVPKYEKDMKQGYLDDVIRHLKSQQYDFVLLTKPTDDGREFPELKPYIHKSMDWDYWRGIDTREDAANTHGGRPEDWAIVCSHCDGAAYIYGWIRFLESGKWNVRVIGGRREECVRALKESLDYLEIANQVLDELVYP